MDFDIKVGGDLPPSPGGRGSQGKYVSIARAARENPGEWVHVEHMNPNIASGIRKGNTKGFEFTDDGWFEAASRDVSPDPDTGMRTCTLWVRYHTGPRPEGD